MSRFIVSLTDDERTALERVRAAGGFRSHADAVRGLIRRADGEDRTFPAADINAVADGSCGRPPPRAATVSETPSWPPTRPPGSMLKKDRK